MMTVAELISHLKTLPPELIVACEHQETIVNVYKEDIETDSCTGKEFVPLLDKQGMIHIGNYVFIGGHW